MLKKAPVLGGERGLDQMVGNFLQRHGVAVQDAALADLVAEAIDEGDAVFAREDALFVELRQGRDGEHKQQREAAKPERQGFRKGLVEEPLPAAEPETGEKAGDAVPAILRPLPGFGQGGIDPGVDPEPVDGALAATVLEKPIVHVPGLVSFFKTDGRA